MGDLRRQGLQKIDLGWLEIMKIFEKIENPFGSDVWIANERVPIFQGYKNDDPNFMAEVPRAPRPTFAEDGQTLVISIKDPLKIGVQNEHDSALGYLRDNAIHVEREAKNLLYDNFNEVWGLISKGSDGCDPDLLSLFPRPSGPDDLVNLLDPPSIELGWNYEVIVLRFMTSWEDEHGVCITVFCERTPRLELGDYWDNVPPDE